MAVSFIARCMLFYELQFLCKLCGRQCERTGAIRPLQYIDGQFRFFPYTSKFLKESKLALSRRMGPDLLSR